MQHRSSYNFRPRPTKSRSSQNASSNNILSSHRPVSLSTNSSWNEYFSIIHNHTYRKEIPIQFGSAVSKKEESSLTRNNIKIPYSTHNYETSKTNNNTSKKPRHINQKKIIRENS